MKNFFKLCVLYLCLIVINWWVSTYLSSYGFSVDIILVTALAVAVFSPQISAYVFAFFSGILVDFMGNYLFGSYSLCFLICAYIITLLRSKIDFRSLTMQIILVLVMSILVKFIYGFLGFIFIEKFVFSQNSSFFTTIFLNCLISIPVFTLVRKLIVIKE